MEIIYVLKVEIYLLKSLFVLSVDKFVFLYGL